MAVTAFSARRTRSEYPEENDPKTFGPFQAAGIAGNTNYPLWVTDRELDIESIVMRAQTAGSAGTIAVGFAASGTAMSSGTLITGAEALTQLTDATAFLVPLLTTGVANKIPAGSIIFIRTASTPATIANLCITIRPKTERYRTNDAGRKNVEVVPGYGN